MKSRGSVLEFMDPPFPFSPNVCPGAVVGDPLRFLRFLGSTVVFQDTAAHLKHSLFSSLLAERFLSSTSDLEKKREGGRRRLCPPAISPIPRKVQGGGRKPAPSATPCGFSFAPSMVTLTVPPRPPPPPRDGPDMRSARGLESDVTCTTSQAKIVRSSCCSKVG